MREAPQRAGAQILTGRRLVWITGAGAVMAAGTLAAYWLGEVPPVARRLPNQV
jgi:Ca2+-transporting ATPase